MQACVTTAGALVHTAWKDHREKTHRAIRLSEPVDVVVDVLGGPFTDTNRWAATHRTHHSTPDANLYPAVQLADLV